MGSEAIDFRPGLFVDAGGGDRPLEPVKPQPVHPSPGPVIHVEFMMITPGQPKECETSFGGFKVYQIKFHEKLKKYLGLFREAIHLREKDLIFEFYHVANDSSLVGPLTGEETPASLKMDIPPPGVDTWRYNWIKLWTKKVDP